MYALERVFAAAPPLYVVALLLQLWWLPMRLLQIAGWDGAVEHGRDISTAMTFVVTIALIGASWELIRRSRGRVRVGMVMTFAVNVLGLGLQLFMVYASMYDRDLFVTAYVDVRVDHLDQLSCSAWSVWRSPPVAGCS